MDVSLQIEGEAPGEGLAELHDWLRQEPELRGHITTLTGPPKSGELGALTDALSVAVGSGGALTALALSLKTFFAQPRRSDVRIVIKTPDGRQVEVDAKRVADVDTLVVATLGQSDQA